MLADHLAAAEFAPAVGALVRQRPHGAGPAAEQDDGLRGDLDADGGGAEFPSRENGVPMVEHCHEEVSIRETNHPVRLLPIFVIPNCVVLLGFCRTGKAFGSPTGSAVRGVEAHLPSPVSQGDDCSYRPPHGTATAGAPAV